MNKESDLHVLRKATRGIEIQAKDINNQELDLKGDVSEYLRIL